MSFQQIIILLTAYKYLFLFPIVVVEGPIVTVIAGFLASTGQLNPFVAYGIVVVGDLTGDTVSYMIGRWGRRRFIERWGHYIGLTIERIQKIEQHFDRHTAKTIILGKLAYSLEMPFLVAAGLAKVPYRRFLFYTFIPTVPKSLLFLLIGYYFGRAYVEFSRYLNFTALAMVALALLLTLIYFIIRKASRKYTE